MTSTQAALSTGGLTRAEPRRQVSTVALWLIAGAVLIFAMMVALGELLTHPLRNSGLVSWDGSVDRWFVHRRTAGWNSITKVTTFGAETITVISIGLVFFVLLRWQLGRWRESMFLAISVIGEVTIFVSTTLLVERHRPAVPRLDGAPPTSSFPSGHTAASVALYGALALVAWHAAKSSWLIMLATALAVLMPVVVGLSRLYRGMHNPTDVLAGALLACCWLAVTSTLLLRGERRPVR